MTLRLFVAAAAATPLAAGAEFALPNGPARHVQVRRAQPGDPLVLFDGRGGEWRAEVVRMTRDGVAVRVLAHDAVDREGAAAITIALGMPANERMDALVEKATELGAAAIQPLVTERSVLRFRADRAERRRAHWQAIAVAATEQCGRTRVPPVAPVRQLGDWLPTAAGQRWVLDPGASAAALARPSGSLTVLSGPEGGLTEVELAAATALGFIAVGLGPRVLRADTAPLVVLARALV